MTAFKISLCPPLHGEADVHASKNAILPILAATMLTREECVIRNAPRITDVSAMCGILRSCGCEVEESNGAIRVVAADVHPPTEFEAMSKMRASILVLGSLVARLGEASVALPGGCAIGLRPIDMHIKGLAIMGVKAETRAGHLEFKGKPQGATIYLDMPSVGATENIMLAAALANGLTRIENAAKEPEIIDLAQFMNAMGAHVSGAGSSTILVQGAQGLRGVSYTPITDRIVAGTLACAVAIAGGNVMLRGARSDHLRALLFKLSESGMVIVEQRDGLRLRGKALQPFSVRTMYYPGFPTDLQAQLMSVACYTKGVSYFLETVFENRFMHAAELARLGASIKLEDRVAIVEGGKPLLPASVTSTDLRAGAALITAAIGINGTTIVNDPERHIDRGYESIESTLGSIGVPIERMERR